VTETQSFRKKPVAIRARQFTGGPENAAPIINWILTGDRGASWTEAHDGGEIDGQSYPAEPECIRINTLEGVMRAEVGDWIIQGVEGEFYPCKPAIFAKTYGPAAMMDYRYRVQILDIHDGDTITVAIDLGFWLTHTTPVRLARINAPELATDAGKAARQALTDFVAAHPGQWTVQTSKSGVDKYRRWLADVYAPDGTCVNDWLVTNGHAVPYMTLPEQAAG
jgi:endonuclease YncB( thermonuclease family)